MINYKEIHEEPSDAVRLIAHLLDPQDLYGFASSSPNNNLICCHDGVPILRVDEILAEINGIVFSQVYQDLAQLGLTLHQVAESLDLLRAPFTMEGLRSFCMDKNWGCEALFVRRLHSMLEKKYREGSLDFKIVLGGTLFHEVLRVTKILAETLQKVFFQNSNLTSGLTFEEWLKRWQVGIVGYSINSKYLDDIRKLVLLQNEILPHLRKSIRLEYIDLSNPAEWPRIAGESPDVVVTASSLYITEEYGRLIDMQQKNQEMFGEGADNGASLRGLEKNRREQDDLGPVNTNEEPQRSERRG